MCTYLHFTYDDIAFTDVLQEVNCCIVTAMNPVNQKINNVLNLQDLDIRNSGYRFMDQKVTPDVLAFIADCVLNLPSNKQHSFTKNDIWHSAYFSKNIVMMFNKPDADNATMVHEYDKFPAQPLKTLSFAGILTEIKQGRENVYELVEVEILEYISLSDKNAFNFLQIYLEKVLRASGFYRHIENYIASYRRNTSDNAKFADLKAAFESFMLGHTKINQTTEIRRIFPKVLNIIAVANGVAGSKGGRMSEGPYLYSDLMYNEVNFRDIKKLKNISRNDVAFVTKKVEDYSNYEMQKVMSLIRKHHYPNSEVRDSLAKGEATQVHHIFSKSSFPTLRSSSENLILLTAQQHNSKAHPNNRTSINDPDYQFVCLLSKIESIKKSLANKDGLYSKEGLVNVIQTGLGLELSADLSLDEISNRLRQNHLKN